MGIRISYKILYALSGLFFINPDFAYAKSKLPAEFNVIFAKFGIAMLGVALFSILIYVGLSLYNTFFVAKYIKDKELRSKSLNSPRDKDEAIANFIMRNRLK